MLSGALVELESAPGKGSDTFLGTTATYRQGACLSTSRIPRQGTMGPLKIPDAVKKKSDTFQAGAVGGWEVGLGNLPSHRGLVGMGRTWLPNVAVTNG